MVVIALSVVFLFSSKTLDMEILCFHISYYELNAIIIINRFLQKKEISFLCCMLKIFSYFVIHASNVSKINSLFYLLLRQISMLVNYLDVLIKTLICISF